MDNADIRKKFEEMEARMDALENGIRDKELEVYKLGFKILVAVVAVMLGYFWTQVSHVFTFGGPTNGPSP